MIIFSFCSDQTWEGPV